MPTYFFWGEDDFAIAQAVEKLHKNVLDPNWLQFNYHKLPGDRTDNIIEGLNQAITPVFGMGKRLVWLVDTTICQNCSEDLFYELQRTLATIPDTSCLLFTTTKKPDARLKSTKLLKECAQFEEFSLIPPWETQKLKEKVRKLAKEIALKLTPAAVELLVESVGNNTRQLQSELEKLYIYADNGNKVLDAEAVSALVFANSQNSIDLAKAILNGETDKAIGLVFDLINRNESALRIVATLVGQFRTWAFVKLMMEGGEKDKSAIATVAEVGNPWRIPHLQKEVHSVSSEQLLSTLPVLLDLELGLKRGAEPFSTLQTKVIELCGLLNH